MTPQQGYFIREEVMASMVAMDKEQKSKLAALRAELAFVLAEREHPLSIFSPAELRSWRNQACLSQAGLAVLLGVDKMTVSRWERGVREIPPFLHLALRALESRQVGRA